MAQGVRVVASVVGPPDERMDAWRLKWGVSMGDQGANADERAIARITAMCDAAEATGDPARRLAPIGAAAYLVLDDARRAARLGGWERVGEGGDHLAQLAEAITRFATETRHDLDQEWDCVGTELNRWDGKA
jgi:hypothetical protein